MSKTSRGVWHRVSQQEPCRFCKRWDERCAVAKDGRGAICYRNGDGADREKTDAHGNTYWVHQLKPDPRADSQDAQGRDVKRSRRGPERADPDTLHQVYTALLTCSNRPGATTS